MRDQPNPRGLELSLRRIVFLMTGTTNVFPIQFPEPVHPPRAEPLIWIQSKHCVAGMGIAVGKAMDPGMETFEQSLGTRERPLGHVKVLRILVTKVPV